MSKISDNVDLNFLAKLCQESLDEARATRQSVLEVHRTAVQNLELVRRIERRLGEGDQRMTQMGNRFAETDQRITQVGQRVDELKDDLHAMIKIELGGAIANLETRLDARFDRIEDRLEALELKLP